MCFAKVININNQLKYVVYIISSVQWLHIYPVLIGVCEVHCTLWSACQKFSLDFYKLSYIVTVTVSSMKGGVEKPSLLIGAKLISISAFDDF